MQTHLQGLQRKLRNNMPEPEKRLWYFIRSKRFGVKFRRQYVIGNYILYFYSPECKLCIEVDGDSHYESDERKLKDFNRDAFLMKNNIKVLRFTNADIKDNFENILSKIKDNI
ncbi:MAG: endonuclease domain-containing protein [Patescibacteria group bacterium]